MSMHHDDEIIRRLRSALDEVAAGARQEERAMMPFTSPSGRPRRWLAIAAASLLLVGGAVFALSRRDDEEPAAPADTSVPAAPATTSVETTAPPTSVSVTTVPATTTPWFSLGAPGFTAGSIQQNASAPSGGQLVESWAVEQGESDGFVSVAIEQGLTPGVEGDYTSEPVAVPEGTAYFLRPNGPDGPLDWGYELRWFHDDGSAWLFQSSGLTRERLIELATKAVPGSGLPMVIDDAALTVLSSGVIRGDRVAQEYTGDGGTVTVWVEQEGAGIRELISAANIIPTTVAGTPGYAALMNDNSINVTWDTGTGWWGHLTISPELSRGADGLIAEVAAADFPG
ncbi:MAG: hypothetical protein HZB15_14910, partial [Actinobacteria bacterium]|nr:hypothetical protein [Actinomycetota bacterium]